MSFVNLMASHVWSEADIVSRTEAMIHGVVSRQEELILSRKMIGFSLGRLVPTAEEAVLLSAYELAAYGAQSEGDAARTDMARLQGALDYEAAERRLGLPEVLEPARVTVYDEAGAAGSVLNPAVAQDAAERAAAIGTMAIASQHTLELVALRRPVAEVDSEAGEPA